ncbi:MAG: Wzz/FepE/Etk N-terminal domain-containing protein [Thermodesulfobacteriota bacterium]|nr:Wzz/FepE/Etk N-terminal domain-containing protein [Thermodesulfobacteriota bacterium]
MRELQLDSAKDIMSHFVYVVFYRKIIVMISFVVMLGLLLFAIYLITPRYEATVKILVDQNPAQQPFPYKDLVYQPEQGLRSNKAMEVVEISKSRDIAENLVRKHGLDSRYEKRRTNPESTRDMILLYFIKLLKTPKEWLVQLGWLDPSQENYFADAVDEFMEETLSVELIEDVGIVNITIAEQTPELSTIIANEMAALLINKIMTLFRTESNSAFEFNEKQISIVEDRYSKSLEAMHRFKEEWNVISLNDEKILKLERLEELKGQLSFLQADLSEKSARYKEIEKEISKQSERLDSLAIYNEMKEQSISVRTDLSGLREREKSLLKSVRDLENQLKDLIKRENDLIRLEQSANSDKDVYITLKEKQSKLRVQKDSEVNEFDLKIVETAYLPPEADPDWPKPVLLAPVVLFLSITFSLGMALFVEYWSDSLIKISDIEEGLGLQVIAVVPSC